MLNFKGGTGQRHKRQWWTKRAVRSISKHTRFLETEEDNTQPHISTSLQKVPSVNCGRVYSILRTGTDRGDPDWISWKGLIGGTVNCVN